MTLPFGTVTFLFTDIGGSTKLAQLELTQTRPLINYGAYSPFTAYSRKSGVSRLWGQFKSAGF